MIYSNIPSIFTSFMLEQSNKLQTKTPGSEKSLLGKTKKHALIQQRTLDCFSQKLWNNSGFIKKRTRSLIQVFRSRILGQVSNDTKKFYK